MGVAPWPPHSFSVGVLRWLLLRRSRKLTRASVAASGRHRVHRRLFHRWLRQLSRLLLEVFDRVCQNSHLPHDRRDLHLRGHHWMQRAGFHHGGQRRCLFSMGRVLCRSDSSRSLSSGFCHLEKFFKPYGARWLTFVGNPPSYPEYGPSPLHQTREVLSVSGWRVP